VQSKNKLQVFRYVQQVKKQRK